MNPALVAAFLWVVLAHLLALLPSRDHHWRRAYGLIAIGIPIVGWVTATNGPVIGLVVLAMGASVLRWPVIHLARWVRRRGRRAGTAPGTAPGAAPGTEGEAP
ncbi:DUF2484 family protein [Wenxinia saemankumensis]|uniref:DUF2484 family protein n=1 Tax=Wenxinia saemankumensis TaxID=1447782 RepID=A0A1M6CHK8_9RHOB|nr:DUF2484 family protein [Wenxinia saemankumensis]SHI60510.1 Protein of unknown function [Wenxinia saemankumensis]